MTAAPASTRNLVAAAAAGTSLAFSLLTFLLAFLIIPIFLFPAISFVSGGVACACVEGQNRRAVRVLRILAGLLMVLAIGVFAFWLRILLTERWH